MNELRERLRNQREQLRVGENIETLKITLGTIKKAQGENIPTSMKAPLFRKYGELLWEAIPEYVSALDFGEGIRAERPQADIERVPEKSRQVWDLERIDQHGAYLSQGLQQAWQPIFPKREG